MSARSIRRTAPAALVLVVAFVALPALLVVGCSRRFGHASPLHGMDAPWRWTLDAARSWGRRITGDLDTSRELVDLFLRIGLVVAWVCLAVLVATIVSETTFQLRHGMPSSSRPSMLGIGRLGRLVATGVVALLPLAAASPALAGGPTMPRPAVVAPAEPSAGRARSAVPPEPPAHPGWTSYDVQRGDSIWSIAARLVAPDDVDDFAQRIVDANRGTTMSDGRRFTTPALIEPGWDLLVPVTSATTMRRPADTVSAPAAAFPGDSSAAAPDTAPPAAEAGTHDVVAGDSYWRIAAEHIAAVTGVSPSDHDVFVHMEALIADNAPLLGHGDSHLILPGEKVELVPIVLAESSGPPAASPLGPPTTPAVGAPSPVAPSVVDPPAPVADVAPSVVDPAPVAPSVVDPVVPAVDATLPGAGPVIPAVVASSPVAPAVEDPAAPAAPPAADGTPPFGAPGAPAGPAHVPVGEPPVAVANPSSDDDAGVPIGLGLGGAVVLATGAIALLEARRRQRVRTAHVGARLAPVSDRDVTTELALRAASAPERLARLDLALRAAALDLADGRARVFTAEVGNAGDIRLHLDGSATPTGNTWRVDLDDGSWVLPARVSTEVLADSARHAGMPCPALVHLGSTSGGQLFVDLEALGVLRVDVADPLGRDIVRCLAASMTLSPFAATAHVVTVGLEAEMALGTNVDVQQADSLDAALELAADCLGTTRAIATGTPTFALRARSNGGEAWEPAIVFAASADPEPLDPAIAGRGLAVVSIARRPTGDDHLDLGDEHDERDEHFGERRPRAAAAGASGGRVWTLGVRANSFVLEPLGIAVTPCGLGHRGVLDVRELLATAEQPLELRARVVPIDSAAAGDRSEPDWRESVTWRDGAAEDPAEAYGAFAEPAWSLLVQVLGQVGVVTAHGESASFERSKALELVVWLSQHRQRPTRTGARTALWNVDVRDATFANVVSDARRAMARTLPPPAGQEWLARTLTEELPLHAAVTTDADLLMARVTHARRSSSREAIAVLRPGLELVSGMPFAGTSFLWTDAEGIATSLTLLVTGAATDLADRYLAVGDAEGVFWATGQGLKALPGHEELIALRMRAHAGAGDLSGVRHEWEAYERALDADSWAIAQPSPKLVALRRTLLTSAAAVS